VYQAIGDKQWPLPVRDQYTPDFVSQRPWSNVCDGQTLSEDAAWSWGESEITCDGGTPPQSKSQACTGRLGENQLIPKHKQEGILQETPNHYNRGYFPTTKDLRNVAQQAIMQSRSSCFDQVCTTCQWAISILCWGTIHRSFDCNMETLLIKTAT